jgi:hypothetical protein
MGINRMCPATRYQILPTFRCTTRLTHACAKTTRVYVCRPTSYPISTLICISTPAGNAQGAFFLQVLGNQLLPENIGHRSVQLRQLCKYTDHKQIV